MNESVKRWSLVSAVGLGLSSMAVASPMADKIRTFADGGSSEWDAQVKEVLLPAYDSDGSGSLDAPVEVKGVACDVWQAIDAGVKQQYEAGVYVIYGFSPDTIWVGYTLGFDEGMRAAAGLTAKNCLGINDGSGGGAKGGSIADAIRGLPHEGGGSDWDTAVKPLMLGAYDGNGSGTIDSAAEVASIPCDTWSALNTGVKAGWSSGIYIIYGFKPELTWVGYAIGISEEVRGASAAALRNCSLADEVAPDGPPTGSVADRIAGLSDGGSGTWDDAVKVVLLGAFDKNKSGELDKKGEIDAIPCDVFKTLDQGVRDGWGSGIRSIYGFDEDYIWVGSAIGVSESMRTKVAERATSCGLTN